MGAGNGVGFLVEMSHPAHWGRIYAIEENPAALELIAANRGALRRLQPGSGSWPGAGFFEIPLPRLDAVLL